MRVSIIHSGMPPLAAKALNPCAAELFVIIFHSFKSEIMLTQC